MFYTKNVFFIEQFLGDLALPHFAPADFVIRLKVPVCGGSIHMNLS